jgi:hypothetical protein
MNTTTEEKPRELQELLDRFRSLLPNVDWENVSLDRLNVIVRGMDDLGSRIRRIRRSKPRTHVYDEFLAQLERRSLHVDGDFRFDGEIVWCGCDNGKKPDSSCYCQVRRAVVRIEFLGYRKHRMRSHELIPYIREVMSCGHWHEHSLGSYPWKRQTKYTACSACGKHIWKVT